MESLRTVRDRTKMTEIMKAFDDLMSDAEFREKFSCDGAFEYAVRTENLELAKILAKGKKLAPSSSTAVNLICQALRNQNIVMAKLIASISDIEIRDVLKELDYINFQDDLTVNLVRTIVPKMSESHSKFDMCKIFNLALDKIFLPEHIKAMNRFMNDYFADLTPDQMYSLIVQCHKVGLLEVASIIKNLHGHRVTNKPSLISQTKFVGPPPSEPSHKLPRKKRCGIKKKTDKGKEKDKRKPKDELDVTDAILDALDRKNIAIILNLFSRIGVTFDTGALEQYLAKLDSPRLAVELMNKVLAKLIEYHADAEDYGASCHLFKLIKLILYVPQIKDSFDNLESLFVVLEGNSPALFKLLMKSYEMHFEEETCLRLIVEAIVHDQMYAVPLLLSKGCLAQVFTIVHELEILLESRTPEDTLKVLKHVPDIMDDFSPEKMLDVYEDVLAICNEIIATLSDAKESISDDRDFVPKELLLRILENFHIIGLTGERLGVHLDELIEKYRSLLKATEKMLREDYFWKYADQLKKLKSKKRPRVNILLKDLKK